MKNNLKNWKCHFNLNQNFRKLKEKLFVAFSLINYEIIVTYVCNTKLPIGEKEKFKVTYLLY